MPLELVNTGDSTATVKAKMNAMFNNVGLPASQDTTEATNYFNQLVSDSLITPLSGLSDKLIGSLARSRINAAISALNGSDRIPMVATNRILGAGGLDYALYDSSALDRMWQESTGQTPAVLASPVGLIVGREKQAAKTFAQVMAGQPELFVPGSSTDASVAPGSSSESPPGTITVTGDGTNTGRRRFTIPTVAGKSYQISLLVSSSAFGVQIGSSAGTGNILGVTLTNGPLVQTVSFVATTALTHVQFSKTAAVATTGTVQSIKEVPAHYASQASAGARPVLQSDGLKFDGSDDNLLTDWFAQTGANCIIAQVSVPATVVVNQVLAGAEVSGAGGFWLGIGTDGRLRGKLGDAGSVSFASADYRGQTIIAALSANGLTGNGFVQEASYPITGSGTINPAQSWRAGALQNNGVPAGFFGGSIKRLAFGKISIDLAQFQQIRAEWLAAA